MDLTGLSIAFDLDGTLVDTAPDLIGALNLVLLERDLAPVPVASARALVGRGARALIERGFAAEGHPLSLDETPELVARFLDIYRGRIAEESRPFPGLETALSKLTEAGAKLSVCTNKPTDLSELLLDALGLKERFGAVVGAGSAAKLKPDQGPLILAIERAGGDPARAIMVGDSETDVATARAAKLPVIAVSFGYTELDAQSLGADILIDHFDALPAAVERLLPGLAARP
jgi:phosphoglycolate phosphatase